MESVNCWQPQTPNDTQWPDLDGVAKLWEQGSVTTFLPHVYGSGAIMVLLLVAVSRIIAADIAVYCCRGRWPHKLARPLWVISVANCSGLYGADIEAVFRGNCSCYDAHISVVAPVALLSHIFSTHLFELAVGSGKQGHLHILLGMFYDCFDSYQVFR